ncbi:MAG: Ger(x)C family spore germination protein [Eubacteriales bacterium]
MKKLFVYLLIISALFLPAGCWDNRDLNRRAFVTAIGLDAADDEKNTCKVSFEIIRPALLNTINQQGQASTIRTVTAGNIDMGMQQLQTTIPRVLALTHMRVVVIGEKMARQVNFKDIADYIEKNPEVARRVHVMFVQGGEAQDILKIKPQFAMYVAKELIDLTKIEPSIALARANPFSGLIRDLRATGGRGFGERITLSDNGKTIALNGGAVFNKWKVTGWLNAAETKNANWIVGEAGTKVEGNLGQGKYTYLCQRHSASIKPVIANGQLSYKIKFKSDGMITQEQNQQLDLTKPSSLNKLEKVFSQVITENIKSAVDKSQKELGIDYLGFGKALEKSNPEYYKKLDWEKTFPSVPVNIEVKTGISMVSLSR